MLEEENIELLKENKELRNQMLEYRSKLESIGDKGQQSTQQSILNKKDKTLISGEKRSNSSSAVDDDESNSTNEILKRQKVTLLNCDENLPPKVAVNDIVSTTEKTNTIAATLPTRKFGDSLNENELNNNNNNDNNTSSNPVVGNGQRRVRTRTRTKVSTSEHLIPDQGSNGEQPSECTQS